MQSARLFVFSAEATSLVAAGGATGAAVFFPADATTEMETIAAKTTTDTRTAEKIFFMPSPFFDFVPINV